MDTLSNRLAIAVVASLLLATNRAGAQSVADSAVQPLPQVAASVPYQWANGQQTSIDGKAVTLRSLDMPVRASGPQGNAVVLTACCDHVETYDCCECDVPGCDNSCYRGSHTHGCSQLGGHHNWTARVDFLYMNRSDPADRLLLGSTDPENRINASQFDFDWSPGIDVQIAANRLGSFPIGVELQYTAIQEYSNQVTLPELGGGVFFQTANPSFAGGGFATIDYTSNFSSFAVNFRRSDAWQAISLGLRIAELDEAMSGIVAGQNQFISWDTSNTFVGFQGGADFQADLNITTISMFGRGAIGINSAELRATGRDNNTDDTPFDVANTDISLSTFVEFGISANVRLTDHVRLGVGYRGILLNDVATASNNLQYITTDFEPAGPPSAVVHTNNSVFYHGLSAGLSGTW